MKAGCAVFLFVSAMISPICSDAADMGFYIGVDAGQSKTELDFDEPPRLFLGPVLPTILPTTLSHDERDTAVGLHVGYAFSKRFAIELAYSDMGEVSFTRSLDLSNIPTASATPNPNFPFPTFPGVPVPGPPLGGRDIFVAVAIPEREEVTLESKSLSLTIIGRQPLGDKVALFGRAGVAAQKIDSSISAWMDNQPIRVIGGDDEHSTGAAVLGLGADWQFHPRWNLRIQGQRHFTLGDESVIFVDIGDVTLFTAGVGFKF
jgi:opacity protein-like surface antigen